MLGRRPLASAPLAGSRAAAATQNPFNQQVLGENSVQFRYRMRLRTSTAIDSQPLGYVVIPTAVADTLFAQSWF